MGNPIKPKYMKKKISKRERKKINKARKKHKRIMTFIENDLFTPDEYKRVYEDSLAGEDYWYMWSEPFRRAAIKFKLTPYKKKQLNGLVVDLVKLDEGKKLAGENDETPGDNSKINLENFIKTHKNLIYNILEKFL